jgi:hypothetical protein
MAVLVLVAMFSFIVLGTVGSQFGGGTGDRNVNQVVGTWKFGEIKDGDFEQRLTDRAIANGFLQGVYNLVRENNVQPAHFEPQFGSNRPDDREREIAAAILFSKKAAELGITYSDEAINDFIQSITSDGKNVGLSQSQIRDLIGSFNYQGRRITEGRLFNALRTELAGRQVEKLFGLDSAIDIAASPAQRWEYFRRLNRRVMAQVVPVKVADYLDQVPEPTEQQLVAFYEANKDRESSPYLPEVGFKQPQRVSFEYLKLDRTKFIEAAKKQVSEEDIRKRFESNKEHYRDIADAEMTTDVVRLREMLGPPPAITPDAKEPDPQPQDQPEPSAENKDPADKPSDKKDDSKADTIDDAKKKTPQDKTPQDKKPEKSPDAPNDKPSAAKRGPGGGADGPEESKKEPALNPASEAPVKSSEKTPENKPKSDSSADTKQPPADPATSKDPKPVSTESTPVKETAKEPPANEKELAKEKEPEKPKPKPQPPEPPISDAEVLAHPKVREDIIDRLARDKAENEIHTRLRELHAKMETFSEDKWRQWRHKNPSAPLSEAPKFDLAALADEEKGITYHSTGLVSAHEAAHDLEIFKTAVDRQYRQTDGEWQPTPNTGTTFYDAAFGEKPAYSPHRAEELGRINSNWYLYWRTNQQAAYVPALDDTVRGVKGPDGKTRDIAVRDMVRQGWKTANSDGPTSARKLATARAESMAKDANAENKTLKEKYGASAAATDKPLEVLDIGPFSFLERTTLPVDGFALKRRPEPPRLEQIEDEGDEFFKSVFALPSGQVGVAKNYPQTVVYVVQVFDEPRSKPEELREEFTRTQYLSFNYPHPEFGQQGDSAASTTDYVRLQRSWMEQLEKEYGVDWKRPLDRSEGEIPAG